MAVSDPAASRISCCYHDNWPSTASTRNGWLDRSPETPAPQPPSARNVGRVLTKARCSLIGPVQPLYVCVQQLTSSLFTLLGVCSHACLIQVLLLAACCLQVVSAADEAPKTGAADSSTTTTKPQQPAAANLHPKNIEEEYYNVPVRSVLGEGPHETPSTGKALNQLGEFDIVYEGPGDATGDLNLTTPLFSEYY